jgi:cytochrome c biogenesis protein CcmG/thiol:disulfide interchange protein DsbE
MDSPDADAPVAPPPAPVRTRPRPVFLLIGVGLAGILAVFLFTGVGTPARPGRPVRGSAVPSFSLPKLEGAGRVGVPADGGGHGRPAILLFFASWCAPCRQEVPALARAYRGQRASKSRLGQVSLIGVDASDPTADGVRFVRSAGVTFPVGADRSYTVTQGLFQFPGLPESVFVEADGTIAGIHLGPLSTASFVSWERTLLRTG